MNFRDFIESTEEVDNVKSLLKKLPKKHAALVKDFKFKYVSGNTLKGDDDHIGLIQGKTITVAGPWNYGREFTTLHEIGHLVWEKLMTPKLKEAWGKVSKKNPKQNQDNEEENFCMAYAAAYTKHPPVTHHHPAWTSFIKNKVPK